MNACKPSTKPNDHIIFFFLRKKEKKKMNPFLYKDEETHFEISSYLKAILQDSFLVLKQKMVVIFFLIYKIPLINF